MLPLVSVPDFVPQYARRYRDLFSPSVLDHFERYLSGLYGCGRRHAQMITDAFVVEIKDPSSLNRFLTEYEWSTEQVNERRLKLLRDEGQTRPRRSGVRPIDDTFNADFRSLLTLVNSTHIFQTLAGFSLALALVSSRYYQY
jgi:hypothetical protein